jgi:hypothetical protein
MATPNVELVRHVYETFNESQEGQPEAFDPEAGEYGMKELAVEAVEASRSG